jgi:hypothetical protein
MMRTGLVLLAVGLAATAVAQTPRPFPVPPREGRTPPPERQAPAPERQAPAPERQAATTPAAIDAPTEATLGVPVYPNAQFLASYNAGRGQRYYLFGVQSSFTEIVAYYRAVLGQNGDEVFDEPATHTFEVGRFRDETMVFPPSVTVKDFTWGSEGYLNPTPGGTPAHFPTIIQVVPAPPGSAR